MPDNYTEKILITGIGEPAGDSAVSYFREKGFHIIGTDIENDQSYAEKLLDIIKSEGPVLLIPTVTEELPVIARLKKIIESYGCTIFVSPAAAIDIANDRLKTTMVMAGHSVPVPISFDECTPKELIVKELGLPFLSKPRFSMGGQGVKLYRKLEEVYEESGTGLVFQEFIPGEEFNINLFIDKDGDPISAVVLKKTTLKDGIGDNVLSVARIDRYDIAQLGMRVSKILKLEGPVDIDVRLREDGKPVFLGINARLGANVLSARGVLDSLTISWLVSTRAYAHV
jgi:carbamoyl-phosphate synthase large subunit